MKIKRKKIYLILTIFVILIYMTGCNKNENTNQVSTPANNQNEKILYKLNAENVPYYGQNFLSYKYENSTTRALLMFYSDGSCFYNSKITNKQNAEIFYTASGDSCNYSVKGNQLTLKLTGNQITTAASANVNQTIVGEFNNTGSYLELNLDDNIYQLTEATYNKILENGNQELLYDPKEREIFDLNGLSIWERTDNKKIVLDLSQYEIKDTGLDIYVTPLWSKI